MPEKHSITGTLIVAVAVSLVCSILVSTAAIVLEPRRDANREQLIRRDILDVAGLLRESASVDEAFENVDTRMVELETGRYVETDPSAFDAERAARDPETGIPIPAEKDVAQIDRRARLARVYLVREGERLSKVVLPVRGYGLWSTMYGLIAVTPDGDKILAIKFYQHAETPGLGDQIDKPAWREKFRDKRIYGADGQVALTVIKGAVAQGDPRAEYQVDGLSGATLTARGVTNTLHYWLGEHAYGPYLRRLKLEGEGGA